jgi:hypothetical protein
MGYTLMFTEAFGIKIVPVAFKFWSMPNHLALTPQMPLGSNKKDRGPSPCAMATPEENKQQKNSHWKLDEILFILYNLSSYISEIFNTR